MRVKMLANHTFVTKKEIKTNQNFKDSFTYEQRSGILILFIRFLDGYFADVNGTKREVYHLALYPASKRSYVRTRYVADMRNI